MKHIPERDRQMSAPFQKFCRWLEYVQSGRIKHALIPSKHFLFLFFIIIQNEIFPEGYMVEYLHELCNNDLLNKVLDNYLYYKW